jgi:hypothetical protein
MEPLTKAELVNQLATLMLDDPDGVMTLLCDLVRRAMVMTIMSQLKVSVDSQMDHIEQDLLKASRTEVVTNQEPTQLAQELHKSLSR